MRVAGCPNTTCGAKPGFYDYVKNKIFNKYDFNFNNGQLTFTKNQKTKIEASKIIKIQ